MNILYTATINFDDFANIFLHSRRYPDLEVLCLYRARYTMDYHKARDDYLTLQARISPDGSALLSDLVAMTVRQSNADHLKKPFVGY